jgi:hypothetical protein
MMREHDGWQVQFVEHDKRPFAYTVGLHDRGLPELLITGLNAQVANRVLKSIGHMMVDDGTILAPAMHIDYQDRFLVEVDCPDVHLKYAGIGSRCSEFAPLCRDAAARVKRRNGRRRLTLQTPIWSHL